MSTHTPSASAYADINSGYRPRIETFTEKAWRKAKENPAVPIGVAAVFYSFYMASVKMRQGKSLEMNYWLRARVATQGFAIMAVSWSAGVFSRVFPQTDKEYPGWLGPLPASAIGVLEGKERRRVEFEERMRHAEEAQNAEDIGKIPSKTSGKAEGGDDRRGGHWTWLRWSGSDSSNTSDKGKEGS